VTVASDAGLTAEQLQTIVESAADAILVVDGDGAIRFVNPSGVELLARETHELVGFPFGHPVATERPARIELVTGNGQRRIAELRASAIEWQGADARLVILRDVSDPVTEEVSRLHLHVRGLSLRLTEIERRLRDVED
jgi:PAS domain-containing protein